MVGEAATAGLVRWHPATATLDASLNQAPGRKPRIAIFTECYRSKWFTEIDPATPNLSPYERSIGLNGYYKDTRDNASSCRQSRIEFIEKLESEGHVIDDKWKRYADWSTM